MGWQYITAVKSFITLAPEGVAAELEFFKSQICSQWTDPKVDSFLSVDL